MYAPKHKKNFTAKSSLSLKKKPKKTLDSKGNSLEKKSLKEHAILLNSIPAHQQSALLLLLQKQYGNSYVNQVLQLARQIEEQTLTDDEQVPEEEEETTDAKQPEHINEEEAQN